MTHPYRQDFFVSWEELHRDTRILCQALLDQQTDWHGIVAITRGGLIPAAIVARELDIRLVDTVCVVSYAGREGREQTDEVRVLKQVSGDGTGLLLIDCLLYTSDAADDLLCVDLGGRRIIQKKKHHTTIPPNLS